MDELGPHEYNATLFHSKIMSILDENIPVLGVLQAPAGSFWPDVVEQGKRVNPKYFPAALAKI